MSVAESGAEATPDARKLSQLIRQRGFRGQVHCQLVSEREAWLRGCIHMGKLAALACPGVCSGLGMCQELQSLPWLSRWDAKRAFREVSRARLPCLQSSAEGVLQCVL